MQTTNQTPEQYTVKRAMERLINRHKSDRIYVKQEDLNALKTVALSINHYYADSKKNDNIMYKLLMILLWHNLVHYNNLNDAVRSIYDALSMPFQFHEEKLQSELNSINFSRKRIDLGFPNDFENAKKGIVSQPLLENAALGKLTPEQEKELIDSMFSVSLQDAQSLVFDIADDIFKRFHKSA